MGLDCYVNVKATDEAGKEEVQEIWYGRKENEIHGWMQRHSGIAAEEFNCTPFPLTPGLLATLEQDLATGKLVPTTGFFFGPPNTPESLQFNVNKLLTAAREAIAYGQEPYYYSWW